VYENGVKALEISVQEYDQALLDLTASLVAGTSSVSPILMIRN